MLFNWDAKNIKLLKIINEINQHKKNYKLLYILKN